MQQAAALPQAAAPLQAAAPPLQAAALPLQFEGDQQLQAVNVLQHLQNVGLLQQMLNGGFLQQLLQPQQLPGGHLMQQQLHDGTHQLVFVGPLPDNDQEDDNDGDLTDFQSKIWFPFFGSLFSNALSQTIFNFKFLNL